MIEHCVFMRFKASTSAAEKQAIYASVAALKHVIPGFIDVRSGANVSPEGLNGGFLDGFIVSFDGPQSRDAYLAHEDHIAVGQRIVSLTDGGLSGLMVFDMHTE